MSPLVSIIIPVYNVAPFLCESLDSVLDQTYKNIEIIIVDDGSDDGSELICEEYLKKDNRIQLIHQQNRGLSVARNAGLNVMNGDYVAFLDSDDAYQPEMIHRMVEAVKRNPADIVICGFYINCTTKRMNRGTVTEIVFLRESTIPRKEALLKLLDGKINNHVWNKLYRSSLFNSIRFSEGHNYEDVIIMPLLFQKSKDILLMDDILLFHRKHSKSITSVLNMDSFRDKMFAIKKREEFLFNHNDLRPFDLYWNRMSGAILRVLIGDYIKLTSSASFDIDLAAMLENEIKSRCSQLYKYSLKTQISYYAFELKPSFYIMIKRCYRIIKNFYSKVKEAMG